MPSTSKQKLIVIVGATASGKTSLAVQLAKIFNGELISADSRQVYIGMDLGTGKDGEKACIDLPQLGSQPTRLIDGIPQFLIDIVSPLEIYTVADFQKQADQLIENMTLRGKTSIIVGGTNLYIQALSEGFDIPLTNEREIALRKQLEGRSPDELLAQLKKVDPVSFEKIDHKNIRRVIRALSASLTSHKPFSEQRRKTNSKYDVLYIGINLPREELYRKIDHRVDERIQLGMIDEVKGLLEKGVSKERLISLGLEYRFITRYIIGEIPSREEMIEKLKFAIHAYARRQLTWLHNKMAVTWIDNLAQAKKEVAKFLVN